MEQLSLLERALAQPEPPPILVGPRLPRSIPDARDNRKAANPDRLSCDQARVLQAHADNPNGLNDFALALIVVRKQTSAGKRRLELERAGLIEFAGRREDNGEGSEVGVYRITADGLKVAAGLEWGTAA